MKKNDFSRLFYISLFAMLSSLQGIYAQSTNACGYTYPPNGTAVATAADFAAYQNSVVALTPTFDSFGTVYTNIGKATANAGAGLTTNDKAIEVTVDGTSSLQIKWYGKYQFYNNSSSNSQTLVNGGDTTNTGLIVRFNGKTYYPEFNTNYI